MNQLEVTILGQSYLLGCPEGGEALLRAAATSVDREMSAIRDSGKVKARERIAVLAALNIAYQMAQRPVTEATSAAEAPAQEEDPLVAQLISRIDQALGQDGQLL